VGKNNIKDVDTLFENNKEIIERLMVEKKQLENVFLDNGIPEKYKTELLNTYNTLAVIIEKRNEMDKQLYKSNEIQNFVGILYNKSQQKYMKKMVKNLENIGNSRNVRIICFTIDNLDMENNSVCDAEVIGATELEAYTIPKYIYNIGYHTKTENVKKIKQLHTIYDVTVINPKNMFSQSVIFDILSSLSNSKSYLLPFSNLSQETVVEYLNKSDVIYLIPERGLIKSSAIKIEKDSFNKEGKIQVEVGNSKTDCSKQELFKRIKEIIKGGRYFILESKSMLGWNGTPLEVRVYVQKGIAGRWSVTHMLAKNELFSNDSMYKDTVENFETVLKKRWPSYIESITEKLTNYSVNTSVYLQYYLANLGSCYLDFIIDDKGAPYLFNFGGWEQTDFLLKLNNQNPWLKYLSNCIDYMVFLKKEKE
jgi:hypothetical protein